MKTLHFILICFFPILTNAQSAFSEKRFPIIDHGEQLINQGFPDSAFNSAQNLIKKQGLDPLSKGQAYFVAGKSFFASDDADMALPYFKKSVALSKKHHIEPLLLRSLMALSAAYGDNARDIDSAIYYLNESKYLSEKLHDTIGIARYYIYLSNIFYFSDQPDSAIEQNYLCETLLLNSNFNYEKGLNYCSLANSLMEIYINTEQKEHLDKAQDFYKKSIEFFSKTRYKIEEAHTRNSLAGSYLYSQDLKAAAEEVQQSINIGALIKDTTILLNGHYTLSTLYEMNGNADSAKATLAKLLFFLDEKGKDADFTFMKEQFGNSDPKISKALINSKMGILSKQVENKRLIKERLVLGFISIIAVISAFAFFFLYRQRNKLHQKALENLLQAQEIRYMKARQDGEAAGRRRIAQQIHDGVGGLLVSAKWNLESALEEIPQKEIKVAARLNENLRLQEHSYKELRRVVHALEREDTPWWEDLKQFYQQLTTGHTAKIRFYTYNLDNRVRGEIGREAKFIVQEVITNALKHARASEINVQINQIDNTLGIIIEDNGEGFDEDRILKGMGLRNIEERCAKLGGTLSFESVKGHGTVVFVDIPINDQNILKENPLLYAGTN